MHVSIKTTAILLFIVSHRTDGKGAQACDSELLQSIGVCSSQNWGSDIPGLLLSSAVIAVPIPEILTSSLSINTGYSRL